MNILKSNDDKKEIEAADLSLENLETALANDTKVKLAGLDIDGQLYCCIALAMLTWRRHSTW